MEEGAVVFFVFSNAGYGESVRGFYPTQEKADEKMGRLSKKGHTKVRSVETKVIKETVLEVEG